MKRSVPLFLTSIALTFLFHSTHTSAQEPVKAKPSQMLLPSTTKSLSRTSVPLIARVLGIRVGWNGQKRLEDWFGRGVRSVGGHSGGVETWHTRRPSGNIVTDGFCYNREREVVETLEWTLGKADATIPLVRRLPEHSGWLGTISLGMSEHQVTHLLKGTPLPHPDKSGGTWTWKQHGYVRPNPVNYDVYRTWTAALCFDQGRLTSIHVQCE